MLVLEWKERAFIEKVNSRCFCWFPAAILVDQNGPPIWRLHTKLYKVAWNVSANNSETVGHKDLRFGQIVYISVFYNISFSWLFPLDGWFPIHCFALCLLSDSENEEHSFEIGQLECDLRHRRCSRWMLNRRFLDIFPFYVKVIQLHFFGSVGSLRKQPTFGGVAKCRLFSGAILSVFSFVSVFKKQNILFPPQF